MPVLEITQAADVGMGSFYNHFDSKEQLFEAAVADVLDAYGAMLDRLTEIHRGPRRDFRHQFPADRPAVSPPPAGEPDPVGQRAGTVCRRTTAWRRAHCAISAPAWPPGGFTSMIPS